MDRLNSTTKRTGAATAGSGGVAVTGTVHGDITMGSPPVARSAYWQQVRRIAPARLLGRDEELAELAEFCHADGESPYLWWQAPAWAGKSALMSWFALNPPETVRVVSFFITARFAGHNDRMAFVDVMLEQLAAAAAEPLPGFLTEATKEAHLLDMLDTAAEVCGRRGQRLVLVVDGLDEDQGVTVGPDAYSIAALLPVRPPTNVRVVATGRPNPPVPPDVPDDHPLRERAVVRRLEVSPHAQVIRTDAERELKRLLLGKPAEQDLLGLVASAGGGLSAQDLAELTSWSVWEIEQHMRAVSGRTFARRANRWRPGTGPEVYVLAHEELQSTAVEWLGPARLTDYRERLHKWADDYRARGWPADTPEYLLRGYFLLLQAIGASDWMLACALDPVRHDRMLDVTGGDAAALAEIVTVQHFLDDAAEPDLSALLRLAVARERLTSRNAHLPIGLPALWARLGDLGRAEALTRSIVEPGRQAEAFSLLLRAAGKAGSWLAEQAEAAVQLVTDPYRQMQAMVHLVEAVAAGGDFDRAERLIHAIGDPYRQMQAMVHLVEAVAAGGDFDRAERLIHAIGDASRRAQAMMALVRALAVNGDLDRAEELARSLPDPVWLTRALVDLMTSGGDQDGLPRIAEQAKAAVAALDDGGQSEEWVRLAAALATTGDIEAAEAFAMRAASLHLQVRSLVAVLRAAPGDDPEALEALAGRAMLLAEVDPNAQWRATELAVTITGKEQLGAERAVTANNADWRTRELANLAAAAAGRCSVGLVRKIAERAEAVPSITGTWLQEEQRAELAVVLARVGDHERAATLLDSIHDPGARARVLMRRLTVVNEADASLVEQGEALISRIQDGAQQARLLVELADTVIACGRHDHARRLAERAESIARSIAVTDWQAKERVEQSLVRAALAMSDFRRATILADSASSGRHQDALLAEVAATAATAARDGDLALAEETALRIRAVQRRGRALIALLGAAIGNGRDDSDEGNDSGGGGVARRLADAAERLARTLTDLQEQTKLLRALMQVLAAGGETGRALAVTRWFADPQAQAQALTELLNMVLPHGDRQLIRAIVSHGVTATRSIAAPEQRAHALVEMVRAMIPAGDAYRTADLAWQAEQMTRWIIEPDRRAKSLTALVRVVAGSGDHALTGRFTTRSEAAIDLIRNPRQAASARIELAAAVAGTGTPQAADRLAAAAESAVRAVPDAYQRACLQADLLEALAPTTNLVTVLAAMGLEPGESPGPDARFQSATASEASMGPCPGVSPELSARFAAGRAAQADARPDATAAASGALDPATALVSGKLPDLTAVLGSGGLMDPAAALASGEWLDAVLPWRIAYPDQRARAMAALAQAAAARGCSGTAVWIAGAITDLHERDQALTGLARVAAADGDLERAAALIQGATGESATPALTEFARIAASGGDLDRIDAFARYIGVDDRATLLVDLMSGDPALARRLAGRAEAAIRDLAHPDRKAELLTTFAHALAAAGDCEEAEAAARTIPDVPARARALAGVAAHAAPACARRLAAGILGTEAWTTSLGVLARLEPSILAAAADDLLRPR
ncbi:hypothetical protein AB0L65_57915 [Nonomuraea sp. NPDC052116]|uniref:hypothetical protein n=1 Tax=Nonomuraea sp. NPDC052116 TaxID=3155665 RepID=UPI00342CA86A